MSSDRLGARSGREALSPASPAPAFSSQRITLTFVLFFMAGGGGSVDTAAFGTLAPIIKPSLHLSNFDITFTAGLSFLLWGIFGYFFAGNLSDRLASRKKVGVPASAATGIFAGLTGAVGGAAGLGLVRALQGAASGCTFPMMYSAAVELSHQKWRALVTGVMAAGYPAWAGFVAPAVTPPLAHTLGWRAPFFIWGAFGLVLSVALWFVWVDVIPPKVESIVASRDIRHATSLGEVLRYRNVILGFVINVLMYGAINLVIFVAPLYLVEIRGFSLAAAGFVVSGWGIGGVIGGVLLPFVSDFAGRKWVGTGGLVVGSLFFCGLVTFSGQDFLFTVMILFGVFFQGVFVLYEAVIPGETVPTEIRGKAISLTNAGATTIGGGLITLVVGSLSAFVGLTGMLVAAIVIAFLAAAVSLAVTETNAAVTARRSPT